MYETPLVIFPPWINKFYILDLKEQNSLIKWITDQGYTLFVVSWVNPDASYADVKMDDYIEDGFWPPFARSRRFAAVKSRSIPWAIASPEPPAPDVLALLAKQGDKSREVGHLFYRAYRFFRAGGVHVPFLQDDFVDGIEKEVQEQGVLRSFIMSRTMSFLRSNDLIYTPAMKSYMMGETPPAFDLLYWNGDGSNLPGR